MASICPTPPLPSGATSSPASAQRATTHAVSSERSSGTVASAQSDNAAAPAGGSPSVPQRNIGVVTRMRDSARFERDVDRWCDHFRPMVKADTNLELSRLVVPQLKKRWPLAEQSDVDFVRDRMAEKGQRIEALALMLFEDGKTQIEELSMDYDREERAA